MEAELEMQLEQAEARLKEQRSLANRLQMEKDQVQDKLEQCQREYHCQVRAKGYIPEKVIQPLRVFALKLYFLGKVKVTYMAFYLRYAAFYEQRTI